MWKRWIIWLLLLLAAGILYLFENGTATLTLLIATAAIPLITMLPLLFASPGDTALTLPERCVCGESVTGIVGMQRRLRLPVSVVASLTIENIRTGETQSLSLPITGRESRFTLRSEYCGLLRVTASALRLEDPFGLVHRTVSTEQTAQTRVVPHLFTPEVRVTETAFALPDSDRFSPDKPGNDPSETFGVREYRPGDSIKTIHWKLSQKSGDTMVRELSLPVEHQVLLRYENPAVSETEPAQIHSMTTVILSISAMLAEQGIIHDLGWRDALWQIDSEDARLAAMDVLLSLPPETESAPTERIGGSYAHVAAVSAEPVLGLADLYNGSRVTVLKPGSGAEGLQPDGTVQICFDNFEQLGRLEL